MSTSKEGRNPGTLKAFKAAITPGLRILVIDHWVERYRNTVRTVGKVQTNGYWFTTGDDPERHWGEHPKAAQLDFDGKLARIKLDERRCWTLDMSGGA